jgi:anti-sigma factor RsiW
MTDRHLRCRDVVELLNDYLDGTLRGAAREEVERHLVACDGCVAFVQQLRLAIDLAARIEPDDVPDHVMDQLLRAFRS